MQEQGILQPSTRHFMGISIGSTNSLQAVAPKGHQGADVQLTTTFVAVRMTVEITNVSSRFNSALSVPFRSQEEAGLLQSRSWC